MTRLRRLALLFVLAIALTASAGARDDSDAPPPALLSLNLVRATGVPELGAIRLEQRLLRGLLTDGCGYRLVRGDERPDLTLTVSLERWWESESPGGSRRFDRTQGREVMGTVHELEIAFSARLDDADSPPEEEPLAARSRTVRRKEASQRMPLWDPGERNLQIMFETVTRDVKKLVCKQMKKLRRGRR